MSDHYSANRMRDLGLAQRQFYGGLMLLVSGGILANLWTLPEYHHFQSSAASTDNKLLQAPWVKTLPHLIASNNKQWSLQVTSKIQSIATHNHVTLISIDSPINTPEFKKQTFAIKKMKTSIHLNGAYPALQTFVSELLIEYPYSRIQSLTIHPTSQNNSALNSNTPASSPLLEAALILDVCVVTP